MSEPVDSKIKAAFKRNMAKTAIPRASSHPHHACYKVEQSFTENPRGWGMVSLNVDLMGWLSRKTGQPCISFSVYGSEGPLGTRGSCDGPQSNEKAYFSKTLNLSLEPSAAMQEMREQLPALIAEAQAAYDAAYEVFMKWEGKGK